MNDIQLIERYLTGELSEEARLAVDSRKKSDRRFREDLVSFARVIMVSMVFGRERKKRQIRAAEAEAYGDKDFAATIRSIFR